MTDGKRKSKRKPAFKATRGFRLYRGMPDSDRIADAFYNVEKTTPESNVPIPTFDAVIEAKEWVDDENKR